MYKLKNLAWSFAVSTVILAGLYKGNVYGATPSYLARGESLASSAERDWAGFDYEPARGAHSASVTLADTAVGGSKWLAGQPE